MKLRPLIHRLLCPVVTACLLSCGVSALRAQATWDAGGSATNLNWSTLLNWSTDASVSGVAVTFGSAGLLAAGTTSSIVDTSLSITSLTFNYISTTTQHTLQINSGVTLTETGTFTLGYAGTGTTKLTVTGAGSWVINAASSNFTVANTSSSVGSTTNTLTLDMSGLSTFSATVSQFNLGTGNDQGLSRFRWPSPAPLRPPPCASGVLLERARPRGAICCWDRPRSSMPAPSCWRLVVRARP
ncbi:hypothetical protein [Verrucomicrobium spinosum]|uniref:hypothetical protein n=1 Tax=Verrucomicrobium spinosum TaxID=2736 RepID=UPI001C46DE58|nr:hypothetical protein [Verrucomicrobium spinosum]